MARRSRPSSRKPRRSSGSPTNSNVTGPASTPSGLLRESPLASDSPAPPFPAATLSPRSGSVTPSQVATLREQANACLEADDIEGYERLCRQLLAHSPHDPEVTLALAGALLHNVRPAQATLMFERFLARWPAHAQATEAGAALEALRPALDDYVRDLGLEVGDGVLWASRFEQATERLESGDYKAASASFEALLQHNPHCQAASHHLSQAYFAQGRQPEALELARQSVERANTSYHALANLTIFLARSGQSTEAQATARRLQGLTDPSPDCWARKAEAFHAVGDLEQARRALDRVRKAGIEPARYPALQQLDRALRSQAPERAP